MSVSPGGYTSSWYGQLSEPAERSARVAVPIVLNAVRPRAVIDVGCGTGGWLRVFGELGVSDVVGVDGSEVPLSMLRIPETNFHRVDLSAESVQLGRTFDLAVSLEVAEHLPESRAESFVRMLASLAPVIMFSAAIPGQGGTEHVNEQWADYWASLFEESDFALVDLFRPVLWNDPDVEYWYSQNAFLFTRRDHISALSEDGVSPVLGPRFPIRAVHPRLVAEYVAEKQMFNQRPTERTGARETARAALNKVRRLRS